MHYTGPVYRPPIEAYTPLLEITYGCSWCRCAFCNMYHGQKFGISPLEDIESDLKEMRMTYPKDLKKIFLVNGDPFVLSASKLLAISELIHKYFPEIECLACYASIRNIKSKSVEDLKELRKAGYNYLYIGLETGDDELLEYMCKGYTAEDEYRELKKLEDAGMDYNALLVMGLGGRDNYKDSACATVKLLNRFKPDKIFITSTSIEENTLLAERVNSGEFKLATERDLIKEELMLLENLEMNDDCLYFGSHPHNLIGVTDYFINRDVMVSQIRQKAAEIDAEKPGLLDQSLSRGHL